MLGGLFGLILLVLFLVALNLATIRHVSRVGGTWEAKTARFLLALVNGTVAVSTVQPVFTTMSITLVLATVVLALRVILSSTPRSEAAPGHPSTQHAAAAPARVAFA